ncbi:siderophore-interacting protein [Microbacterium sediminis]|uniref:siderophore-interacting protein n=1 Tax=Microbacterium sediminis TaxID=904291 RepID=UPI000A3FBB98|nr:siderophore-interacting protein [Microbacterium sediminis]QBR73386.1 siderophore-interacting protein [Microbacterium sediminis]
MQLSNTAPAGAFTLERERQELVFRATRLVAREIITPHYIRVRVQGDGLVGFGPSGHDDHIRIFFGGPETAGAPFGTVEQLRELPSREFTPLHWGEDWLDLEFAVHGDEGVAGVWAANAPIGSVAGIGGPRGSLRIDGTPDGWLLAGDETAVPQIRRYAALIPDGAPARILVEVADAAHEIPIDAPVAVEYVHRDGRVEGSALAAALDAIAAQDRPEGSVFGFVAAEQAIVKPGRALLCERWGLDPERIVVKGYWKRGDAGYHAPHGPGAQG